MCKRSGDARIKGGPCCGEEHSDAADAMATRRGGTDGRKSGASGCIERATARASRTEVGDIGDIVRYRVNSAGTQLADCAPKILAQKALNGVDGLGTHVSSCSTTFSKLRFFLTV